MIIPDGVRQSYLENLIGGLSMSLAGPFVLRLAFHVFVVAVGTLCSQRVIVGLRRGFSERARLR